MKKMFDDIANDYIRAIIIAILTSILAINGYMFKHTYELSTIIDNMERRIYVIEQTRFTNIDAERLSSRVDRIEQVVESVKDNPGSPSWMVDKMKSMDTRLIKIQEDIASLTATLRERHN